MGLLFWNTSFFSHCLAFFDLTWIFICFLVEWIRLWASANVPDPSFALRVAVELGTLGVVVASRIWSRVRRCDFWLCHLELFPVFTIFPDFIFFSHWTGWVVVVGGDAAFSVCAVIVLRAFCSAANPSERRGLCFGLPIVSFDSTNDNK